jgi:hypothetical protein
LKRSVPPVRLELRGSRWERALIALALVAALASCLLADLSWGLRAALALLALGLAASAWRRADHIAGAQLTMAAGIPARMRTPDGAELDLDLIDATILGPLIALSFKRTDGRRLHLALFPDSAYGEDLRRLRVFLRHGADFDTDDSSIQ